MSGYKVVPVEPTAEMERAAESYWNERRFKGLSDDPRTWAGVYQAMLAAAPDLQGEPVGYATGRFEATVEGPVEFAVRAYGRIPRVGTELYAAPQPAEQQPAPALSKFLEKEEWNDAFAQGFNAGFNSDEKPEPSAPAPTFQLGDHVRKTKGSQWKGRVVGTYSTELTPEGYAVESDTEKGSVQIYPVGALEMVGEDVQKPAQDDSAAVRLDKQCREDVAAALGFIRGGNYAWPYLLQQIKDITSAEGKQPAPDATKLPREALAELIKGMAVSVDVSTGESDFGNRYFGVVDEVQWNANERHGMMLLVQEPEANFATPVSPDVTGLVEALQPFADFIAGTDPVWSDERRISTLDYDFTKLRLGLFRKAQAALAAHRKQGGEV